MISRVPLQRDGLWFARQAAFFIVCGLILLQFSRQDAVAEVTDVSKVTTHQPPVLSTPKQYIVGPEDVLDISVWGESELSKTYAVSPEGTINYPLLGVIPVEGITPAKLEEMLKERLAQGYLKEPKITVSVKEFNSKKIMVFGMVGSPGLYKVKGELPLLELLFMVGNLTRESGNRLVIMRKDPKNPTLAPKKAAELVLDDLLLKGDLSKNMMIQPGDIVYFTASEVDKRRIYIMGQVRQPGPYDFSRPITLLEAIKLAGGLTEYAAAKRVQVIRREGDKKITFKFNMNEISSGKKNDDFLVQSGDVIVVPESWF